MLSLSHYVTDSSLVEYVLYTKEPICVDDMDVLLVCTGENQPLGEFALTGKFGRLFPQLRPFTPSVESLTDDSCTTSLGFSEVL
jgi:hypothetical protein